MKKVVVAGIIASFFLIATVPAQALSFQKYSATLTGGEEVPPVDTDTRGSAVVEVNSLQDTIEYTLTVHNADSVTQAHLHCGVRGENGPVVAFLFGKNGTSNSSGFLQVSSNNVSIESSAAGCASPINNKEDLAAALAAGTIYVNVHSVAHPAGVVRGQLSSRFSRFGFRRSPVTGGSTSDLLERLRERQQERLDDLRDRNGSLFERLFGR